MQRRCNAAVVSWSPRCRRGPAGAGSAPRAQRYRSPGCSPRGRRASAPTTSPRSSARASRPPTTCSSACATRAWPCTTPAACTGSRPPSREMVTSATVAPADELHDLSGVVAELLARTHKRSYLGVLRAGELHVVRERGAQGMAKLPGLGAHIADNAHALALGKVDARDGLARGRRALPAGRAAALQRPHDHRSRRPARRAARGPPPRLRGRPRGVRRGLLLHRRRRSSTPAGASSRRSGSR